MDEARTVEHLPPTSPELAAGASQIVHLINIVWPEMPTRDPQAQLERWKARDEHHFVIRDAGEVVAHASIFTRTMFAGTQEINVGCLAGVCVHPLQRGRDLGSYVVNAAWAFMPHLGVEISMYQTGVPGFYEKLGAQLVDNEVYNGTPGPNPFWEPHVMIYPAGAEWPTGPIDINGPGF